jgi:hypothetical protein
MYEGIFRRLTLLDIGSVVKLIEGWEGGKMGQRNATRDQEIFAAFVEGTTLGALATQYGLTVVRIGAIVTSEKNRRTFSSERSYRDLRRQNGLKS